MRIAVTGGAGFIGSTFLRMMVPAAPDHAFLNIDKLTYAANPANLDCLAAEPNYQFVRLDLVQAEALMELFKKFRPEAVIHFAAESHVDRSILGPAEFVRTNILGTFNLLEACRASWTSTANQVFLHVSTDEVYGSLGTDGYFTEQTPYDPSSPYAASKASSDHLVSAYYRTYDLPVKITNCSNNYGPRQFPEKLIPLMILNALENKPLPVYGDGAQIRDWLYVEDHCRAIWRVFNSGAAGETYNIGGNAEKTNLEVVHLICDLVAEETGRSRDELRSLLRHVADRPGHDRRYAMDIGKITGQLNWRPETDFETGLRKTVRWYMDHPDWVDRIRTGEYLNWIEKNYENR